MTNLLTVWFSPFLLTTNIQVLSLPYIVFQWDRTFFDNPRTIFIIFTITFPLIILEFKILPSKVFNEKNNLCHVLE